VIRTGTAGWSIPRAAAAAFPGDGTHLQRYARVLSGAEINSSFHRPHARSVYEKWAAMTPADFRFAVKLPRTITHDAQLKRTRPLLEKLFGEIAGLGDRLGPLLIQLPPSLAFNLRTARTFLDLLRDRHGGTAVCEPRHETWFSEAAERVLVDYRIARVAADPSRIELAKVPGGWPGIVYYRLHGSPRKYWSRYPPERIAAWERSLRMAPAGADAWCVFDNTASGAAIENALELQARLGTC
jgi:uncharacterized protein YecE (DUF72 family)